MDELVLPPEYSQRIFWRSFSTIGCSSVAILSARWDYALISVGTMLTSLNYWRHPLRYGWPRRLDMTWVAMSFFYQAWRAPQELGRARHLSYWCLAAVTIFCYYRARQFGNAGDKDTSSSWHSRIHIVGNVANAILYGESDPDLRTVLVRRMPVCISYFSCIHIAFLLSHSPDENDENDENDTASGPGAAAWPPHRTSERSLGHFDRRRRMRERLGALLL